MGYFGDKPCAVLRCDSPMDSRAEMDALVLCHRHAHEYVESPEMKRLQESSALQAYFARPVPLASPEFEAMRAAGEKASLEFIARLNGAA